MFFESMHFQRFRPEVHLLGVSLVARNEQIFGQWGRTSLVAPPVGKTLKNKQEFLKLHLLTQLCITNLLYC